jgi:hypothetical protein
MIANLGAGGDCCRRLGRLAPKSHVSFFEACPACCVWDFKLTIVMQLSCK